MAQKLGEPIFREHYAPRRNAFPRRLLHRPIDAGHPDPKLGRDPSRVLPSAGHR